MFNFEKHMFGIEHVSYGYCALHFADTRELTPTQTFNLSTHREGGSEFISFPLPGSSLTCPFHKRKMRQ